MCFSCFALNKSQALLGPGAMGKRIHTIGKEEVDFLLLPDCVFVSTQLVSEEKKSMF